MLKTLFFQSLMLGLGSVVFSLFFAFLSFRFLTTWSRPLFLFSFLISSSVVSSLFLQHWGTRELGWLPILLCHAWMNFGWVAIQIQDACQRLPKPSDEVGRSLGLSFFQRLFFLKIKPLLPILRMTSATVFVFSVTSFAPVLILGGGPPVSTLETESAFAMKSLVSESFPVAWALLLQFFILLGALFILNSGKDQKIWAPIRLQQRQLLSTFILSFVWIGGWLFFYHPILWQPEVTQILSAREALGPWWNSVQVALGSSLLTLVIVSFFVLRFHHSNRLMVFFGALSPVTLGAVLFYFSSSFWSEGSNLKVILAQSMVFSAFAYRSLSGWFDPNFFKRLQIARSLGLDFFARLRWVWWPSWGKVFLRTGGVLFLFSLGDVVALTLFADESKSFVQLEILRSASRMDLDRAMAWSYYSLMTALLIVFLGAVLGAFKNPKILRGSL